MGAAAAPIPNCTPKSNVEAIFDDSGSMAGTDPNKLRRDALISIINARQNSGKTLGAVEFGSSAKPIFAPGNVGAQRAAMVAAITAAIQDDEGSTNYNAGFALAGQQNPNATARIFLTDGDHNVGPYAGGHAPGPPTYVIGFSNIGDQARLQEIATSTGGAYFPNVTAGNLTQTLTDINAALNCQTAPQRFVDQFTAPNQVKAHALRVPSGTQSYDLVMSWSNPLDKFAIGNISIRSRGRTVARYIARSTPSATASGRRRRPATRLLVKTTPGATFQNVVIRRVKRGRLKFQVKSTAFSGQPTTVTTQLTPSRRR
jgi:hypothetical protein